MSKDLSSKNKPETAVQPVEASSSRGPVLGTISTLFIAFGSFFGAQFMGAILIVVLLGILGNNQEDITQILSNNSFAQLAVSSLIAGLVIYFLLRVIKWQKQDPKEIFMLRKIDRNQLVQVALTYGMYFVVMAVVTIVVSLLTPVDVNQAQELGIPDPQSLAEKLSILIMLVVIPPIYEELLFRGYLFNGLRKYSSFLVSAILTSLLFGAAHLEYENLNWIAAIDTLVFSGFLIYISQKHRSIYSSILLHAIKNGIAFIVLFVA
jgi:membrane protease YdiL (CAAX protease family)